MNKLFRKFKQPADKITKIPWIDFLFITTLFFFAQHDLFYGIGEQIGQAGETASEAVQEGNIVRRVVFMLLGIYGIFVIINKGRNSLKINGTLGWLILFYLAWTFLSLIWSDDFALTFRRLILLMMFCLGAVAVANRFSDKDILRFVFSSTILYLAIGIVAEILLGSFRPFDASYRFGGTLHPNHQGINCALLFMSSICLTQKLNRGRLFFIVCALFAFSFLILTKSRTSLASIIVAGLALWTLRLSRGRRFGLLSFLCSLFFLFFLFLLIETILPIFDHLILLGRTDSYSASLTGRIPLWEECISYISDRPLLGYGYMSFWTPDRISEISTIKGWGIAVGHSVYLDLCLGTGLIGMTSFLLILVGGVLRSFFCFNRFSNISYAFFGAFLVFCILDGLLESALINSTFLTFLSMTIFVRLAFKEDLCS
jgi:O-antigen ligase